MSNLEAIAFAILFTFFIFIVMPLLMAIVDSLADKRAHPLRLDHLEDHEWIPKLIRNIERRYDDGRTHPLVSELGHLQYSLLTVNEALLDNKQHHDALLDNLHNSITARGDEHRSDNLLRQLAMRDAYRVILERRQQAIHTEIKRIAELLRVNERQQDLLFHKALLPQHVWTVRNLNLRTNKQWLIDKWHEVMQEDRQHQADRAERDRHPDVRRATQAKRKQPT